MAAREEKKTGGGTNSAAEAGRGPGAGLEPPRHIAIIMDGNGRWASKRGLPRAAGHLEGAETLRRIQAYCHKIGVPFTPFPRRTGSAPPRKSRAS